MRGGPSPFANAARASSFSVQSKSAPRCSCLATPVIETRRLNLVMVSHEVGRDDTGSEQLDATNEALRPRDSRDEHTVTPRKVRELEVALLACFERGQDAALTGEHGPRCEAFGEFADPRSLAHPARLVLSRGARGPFTTMTSARDKRRAWFAQPTTGQQTTTKWPCCIEQADIQVSVQSAVLEAIVENDHVELVLSEELDVPAL